MRFSLTPPDEVHTMLPVLVGMVVQSMEHLNISGVNIKKPDGPGSIPTIRHSGMQPGKIGRSGTLETK